jgi:hypothetical protein
LAVNRSAASYRYLAQAAAAAGRLDGGRRVANAHQLDVPSGGRSFSLAELLRKRGQRGGTASRLLALEETPRYRAALRLLLELNRSRMDKVNESASPELLPAPSVDNARVPARKSHEGA